MPDLRAQKFQQGFLMGQAIVDAMEQKKMRDELRAANAMTPEQQQLGLNAPAQGQVPTGYEDYIQAGEGGKFVPKQTEGLDEAGLQQRQVIAERFNAPTAFAGEKTMYTLGGLTRATPFTPDEVAQARMERKADIYSGYGKEDVAEQLRTNAMARKLSGLQIRGIEDKLNSDKEFKEKWKTMTEHTDKALNAVDEADVLFQNGNTAAATEKLIEWRNSLGRGGIGRVNPESGIIERSTDGGKSWEQSNKGVEANAYNPRVYEKLKGEIKNSLNDQAFQVFGSGANREEILQLMKFMQDKAVSDRNYYQSERQFDKTFGLKTEELQISKEQGERKLDLMDKELKQKGLLIPSEIFKNMGVGRHYGTANELQDFQLKQLKDFTAEKDSIIKDLDSGKIDKRVAQERLNMAGLKYGGKLAEPKQITSTALKDIEEVAMNRYPDWNKMPEAKKQEVRAGLKAEMGFGTQDQGTVDYLGIASKDKGNAPGGNTGLRPAATPLAIPQTNTGLVQGMEPIDLQMTRQTENGFLDSTGRQFKTQEDAARSNMARRLQSIGGMITPW